MSILLAALAAITPGLYAWFSGRKLIAALDDPAFADLHFARSRHIGVVTIVAIVLASSVGGLQVWWTIPVTVLALLAGAWPARRVLFQETWSFASYLRFSLAAIVGMAGFWILLVSAPLLILDLGRTDVRLGAAAAVVIAVVLAAISFDYPRFWLALHRAGALARPELDERFEAILEKASCVRPTVHRFGVPGGHIMNAFALPATRSPAVAFGDSLLANMTPDEVAAVFAHEVAHLEHFSPRRLRSMALLSCAMVLASTAVPAVLAVVAPRHGYWASLLLIVGVLFLFLKLVGKGQANETASDLRAAELTGDPETLIAALTRLHVQMRLPRHWPQEIEPSVSHPSLARRIQAIREHMSDAGRTLADAVVARSTVEGGRVALDDARAYWFEGVAIDVPDDLASLRERASSYRAHSYGELSELRIASAGAGRALRARDLNGQVWTVPIHAHDAARLSSALEVVDTRLGRRRQDAALQHARLIAAAMLLALVAAGEIGILLVPLALVLFRPGIAAVVALGTMAIVKAVALTLGGELGGATITAVTGASAIVLLGGTALWLAWRNRRSARHTRPALVTLGVTAALLSVLVAGLVASSPDLALRSPAALGLALTTLGIGGALCTHDRRAWRRAAAALAIASIAAVMAMSREAGRALGTPVEVEDVLAHRAGEIALARAAYRLELSPGGQRWAVQSVMADGAMYTDDEDVAFRWTIGAIDGAPKTRAAAVRGVVDAAAGAREIEALDLAFVDDDRVIALAWRRDSLEVRVEHADPNASPDGSWSRTLPSLYSPAMFVDAPSSRWVVAGRRDDGALVAVSGTIAGEDLGTHFWPSDSMWLQPLHIAGDGAALVYSVTGPRGTLDYVLAMMSGSPLQVDLWRLAGGARERVATIDALPLCRPLADGAMCVGRSADRSQLWHLSGGGDVSVLGVLPSGYDVRNMGRGGSIAAVARDGTGPLLIDPSEGIVRRARLRGGDASLQEKHVIDAQASGGVLAILEAGAGGTIIGLYRLGDAGGTLLTGADGRR